MRAKLHRSCTLHLEVTHLPFGHPTIKGSESGEGARAVLGRKRCLPRLSYLLRHFWEERHWGLLMFSMRCPEISSSLEHSGHGGGFHLTRARRSQQPRKAWPSAQVQTRTILLSSKGDAQPNLHPQKTIAHSPMQQWTSGPPPEPSIKRWVSSEKDQQSQPEALQLAML